MSKVSGIGHMLHVGTDDAGKAFRLPEDMVTQTAAVIAKKGSGKSYTASVIAEEMLKLNHQVVVIDPTGAWWGLRADAAGGPGGFPVIVIGGDHADVSLEEGAGEILAQAIVERRFSAILDVSNFRKGETRRFVTAFLETLYRLNREPMHLFVDEADDICPQVVRGEEARMVGAMEDVVKRGRKKGIGCTLITQRPADLAKQVLTQVEILMVLRLIHPRDLKPIQEWVNVHADPDRAADMMKALPGLGIGTAYFWSPGWLDLFKVIKIRSRDTFDSGATPKPGQNIRIPKKLAAVDVEVLGKEIASTVEKAKENNPVFLRKQIAELKARVSELENKPVPSPVSNTVTVEVPVMKEAALAKFTGNIDRIERIIEILRTILGDSKSIADLINVPKLEKMAGTIRTYHAYHLPKEALAALPFPPPLTFTDRPTGIKPHAKATDTVPDIKASVNGGLRRMLIALAQRDSLSARQLGVRAGLSSSSGTFGTYLARARAAGWIVGGRDRMEITQMGIMALGKYDPLPTGRDLLQYWLNELGTGGAGRMLNALADVYPKDMTKQELGEASGISSTSGTFGTYLSKLRTLELITGSANELRASGELFD